MGDHVGEYKEQGRKMLRANLYITQEGEALKDFK
jgi:hypothetical protein